MAKYVKFIIVLSVLVYYSSFPYLYAQEKEAAREEAQQHYQQGKSFYSQGRYQEAVSEFDKTIELLNPPRVDFIQKAQKQQQEAIAQRPSQETAALEKRLAEKKKETEETEEAEKAEVTKPALIKEAIPETEEAKEREYYIDIGDVLDISVWRLPERLEKEYFINIGDVLDISVWQIPDLSRPEFIVRPDGKISFPLIGDVKAEALTLTQLDDAITEKLKSYIKAPEVSIMIRGFGEQENIPDLSRAEVIVRPDGKISFPLAGDIKAEGLTFTQLDNIITEKLKTYVKLPKVSIMIRSFGEQANKVVILGEILGPGVYKFGAPPSITEVIASAGGYTKYAVLNSIMVIRGDLETNPKMLRVNFAKILKSGKLSENIFLRPNDIVYVPRSFIGNMNTFMEILQPAYNEYMQQLNARHLSSTIRRKGGI